MAINGTSNNSTPVQDTSSSKSITSMAGSNKDMFLSLLVAQIQNQNPLNPLDSTQYVTQLAQFTELEQITTIRQDVESMANAAAAAK